MAIYMLFTRRCVAWAGKGRVTSDLGLARRLLIAMGQSVFTLLAD